MVPSRLIFHFLVLCGSPSSVRGQPADQGVSVEVTDMNRIFDEDVKEVDSTAVELRLFCHSPTGPTEWVYDDDRTNITSPKFPCAPSAWTFRWISSKMVHVNHSFILLACDKFESGVTIGCRSVANHSDTIVVKFEPNQTTGRLHITQEQGAWMKYTEPESANSDTCVSITAAQTKNGIYWKCNGPDGKRGRLTLTYCGATSICANLQRQLKRVPVCLNTVNLIDHTILIDQGWTKMHREIPFNAKYPGGVATCELHDGKYRGAAVEFFFAGKDKSTLHFSLAEISMNDLIWFDPTPTSITYYTEKDIFKTVCKVSVYGLAADPRLLVTLNGATLAWAVTQDPWYEASLLGMKQVIIDFKSDGFGPGSYEIECSAPVWNTSEWASQTIKFDVRDVVLPYFDVAYEKTIVNENDANVRLHCDAKGDPAPDDIEWSHSTVPGLLREGEELIFTSVRAKWVNGSTVSCTAVNKYGQRATKQFTMQVAADESDETGSKFRETYSSNSTWTIVGGVVLFCLVLTVAYLYWRFVRFGRAVAQALSDEEVKEFQQGKTAPASTGSEEDQVVIIECLPYNSEFEVAKENISVDFNTELGSGQYGVVYKGHIKLGPDAGPMQIAVKTVRPNVPIEYFKALLSELKILAYIGGHENIARLVGAYSSDIKQRALFVGVEFCKTSILQHLRKNACRFTVETCFTDGGIEYGNVDRPITTLDLIRWSAEIAAGMEYLSEKRVVHGDLAARNVLLSFDFHAKICDFGLARQLVDYTYIKATKCNLPWKWMAIESLRQMQFSTMSDVWSYGVTCWEIFSLGDVPYPCMAWSWEFVNGLVAGNRLTKPQHASPEIFSMLLQCWFERKERRPVFSELKRFFQGQERQLATSSAYANTGALLRADS